MLPYFKKSEDQQNGEDEFHAVGGGLSVQNMRAKRDICEALIDAAEELGVPRNKDYNGATQEGASYYQQTAKNGFRCSTAVGFLNPARSRDNLDITKYYGFKAAGLTPYQDISTSSLYTYSARFTTADGKKFPTTPPTPDTGAYAGYCRTQNPPGPSAVPTIRYFPYGLDV